MSDLLAEILIIFFEVLCCKIFYEIFGKLRFRGWINIVQMIILECGVFLVSRMLSDFFIVKQIVMISVFALLMFWHVKITLAKSFVLALLHQAMILSIDYFTYFVSIELGLTGKATGNPYSIENILVIMLGKAIVFLCVLVVGRKLREKSTEILVDVDWLKILIFPIFTIIIITAMISVFSDVETPEQVTLILTSSFGMIGMNIVVLYLINDIVDRETQLNENRIFRIQAKNQAEMYRSISDNFDKQKKKTHEYKNQIVCIETLVKKKQFAKVEE